MTYKCFQSKILWFLVLCMIYSFIFVGDYCINVFFIR